MNEARHTCPYKRSALAKRSAARRYKRSAARRKKEKEIHRETNENVATRSPKKSRTVERKEGGESKGKKGGGANGKKGLGRAKEKKGVGKAKEKKLTEIAIGLNREIVAMMRGEGVGAEGMEVNLASTLTSSRPRARVANTTPPLGEKKQENEKKEREKEKERSNNRYQSYHHVTMRLGQFCKHTLPFPLGKRRKERGKGKGEKEKGMTFTEVAIRLSSTTMSPRGTAQIANTHCLLSLVKRKKRGKEKEKLLDRNCNRPRLYHDLTSPQSLCCKHTPPSLLRKKGKGDGKNRRKEKEKKKGGHKPL